MSSFRSKVLELTQRITRKKRQTRRLLEDIENGRVTNVGPPPDLSRRHAVATSEVFGHRVYKVSPSGARARARILYLHGGAYIYGFSRSSWELIGELVDGLGCEVVAPDYPRPPKHHASDVFAMLVPICHDLVGHESADKLTLMGDSAGGGIALALAQLLRDRHMPRPEHIVLLSPWLDATMSNPEIREIDPVDTLLDIQGLADAGKLYAGPLDPADPMVSPINGSLAGLGLITVFIGTHDLFLADCRRLRALAEAHAIKIDYREYANMVHTWMLYSLPEARQTKKEIIELLGKEFTEV